VVVSVVGPFPYPLAPILATIGGANAQVPDGVRSPFRNRDGGHTTKHDRIAGLMPMIVRMGDGRGVIAGCALIQMSEQSEYGYSV
jgi:hypothetical protein